MLTASEARDIASKRFTLDKETISAAIHEAIANGQFRVEFDYRRWPETWAEEWLEELGYDWTYLHGPNYEGGCIVEVSWL